MCFVSFILDFDMRVVKFTSNSVQQTHAVARVLWRTLKHIVPFDHACVIALRGDLGAGKTAFMQGFAKAMGLGQFMTSPTFLLMRSFDVPGATSVRTLVHIDSWRIQADDLGHLGMADALRDPHNIICIEWAERVKSLLPYDTIWVDFKHVSHTTRLITFRIP